MVRLTISMAKQVKVSELTSYHCYISLYPLVLMSCPYVFHNTGFQSCMSLATYFSEHSQLSFLICSHCSMSDHSQPGHDAVEVLDLTDILVYPVPYVHFIISCHYLAFTHN
jgi:hypothetical protein